MSLTKGRRFALVISSSEYSEPNLRKLMGPTGDAIDLARILGDPKIGSFNVRILSNEPSHRLSQEIEAFFITANETICCCSIFGPWD